MNANEQQEILSQINELESKIKASNLHCDDVVRVSFDEEFNEQILKLAKALKPWRKGPFELNKLFIDSEWQSFMKFNILKPYMNELEGKIVADVGCNNGYYLFKMLEFKPEKLIGFDPCVRPFLQFKLINALAKTDIKFELLGVEDLAKYALKFDIIFCLGVLYHRSDPITMLKNLKSALNKGGAVFLDTMYIESEKEIALIPRKTYSKIANIFFIPSILALRNWCERAGFSHFELLATKKTDSEEQRKTSWSEGYSLGDFLSKKDQNLTCENYPAPRRVYVKLKV